MEDIVERIKHGNIQSFKIAYDTFHKKLYFFILKYCRSSFLAEEVVQLTFIKLWENRSRLSSQHSLSSQIFRIGKSIFIDLLRKEDKIRKIEQADLPIRKIEDGEKAILLKEELQLLQKKIDVLPPIRKKVFELSRFDGRSYKEIAEEMSITPKTVENHLALALKQIKISIIILILLFFH